MTTAVIVVPAAAKLLSANERLHWRAKSTRTKTWRQAAALTARSGKSATFTSAHVTVSIRFPTNHRRDVGNYYPTAKALLDGLVDAGLLPDDNDDVITGPDMRRDLPNGPLRVTIELEGVTA